MYSIVWDILRYSKRILRSSMGSIFDNNPCFGTSNCRLYQCSEMHVEQTQHMKTSTCRQLTAGPAQARVLLKPYRRWECIHRHLMVEAHRSDGGLWFRSVVQAVALCQIRQQNITCCNTELSLRNHRYSYMNLNVKFIWQNFHCLIGNYLHLTDVGFWWLRSILLIICTLDNQIAPPFHNFLLMFKIKQKTPFKKKLFPLSKKKKQKRAYIMMHI